MQQRWFLSYHSPDQVLATRLKEAIERKGDSVFFAPTSMKAGGFWSAQLAQEIADATAFILLVGEHGVGQWQMLEYDEALDQRVKAPDFPVILVLLEGQSAPGLPFLRRLHWIITADPSSDRDIARLLDAAAGVSARQGELWRFTSPYRGLLAMKEQDSGYFFGRERETVEVINALATSPDKLPVLLGNSGVGKSSLAQAGVLASLMRQSWPEAARDAGEWPATLKESRRWCFLTLRPGGEPVRSLVEVFLDTWQFRSTDPERVKQLNGWIELLVDGKGTLRDLLDSTRRRYKELALPEPPAFLLYIDQSEELYVRAGERQRRRLSEIVAQGIGDPCLYVLMSLRADFFGELQNDTPLYNAHRLVSVAPLGEAQLLTIVTEPAKLLSVDFENQYLATDIAKRAAEESTRDAGALPLLSYLLEEMWEGMQKRGDGELRLSAQAIDLGRVLVDRANSFIVTHPDSENSLRRILTLKLATVRQQGEPTRRRAVRSEFTEEEWRLVSELADHPNRLLVTATFDDGATCAEVAHEAIFRRWDKLRHWIASEREFLIWKSELDGERHSWEVAPSTAKADALLMGLKLAQAHSWLATRGSDLPEPDREFIEKSIKRDAAERAQRHALRRQTRQLALVAAVLVLGIAAGLAWSNQVYLKARAVMLAEVVWSKVLTTNAEHLLKPGDTFRECADCPEIVVIPAGEFMMGSSAREKSANNNERPLHKVSIPRALGVAKFEITSDEWDACVLLGGCSWPAPETGWGRGPRPVMNVSWDDAQQYVNWLCWRTGKLYRLLSEAEWEYAARAGSDKAYSWGDEIGKGNANCKGCGSKWDWKQTAPVGSFAANAFGLYDMHGNVFEWVEDCYERTYNGAPVDGSARISADCSWHAIRGGSWGHDPDVLRSAFRNAGEPADRSSVLGFRVGRTLNQDIAAVRR